MNDQLTLHAQLCDLLPKCMEADRARIMREQSRKKKSTTKDLHRWVTQAQGSAELSKQRYREHPVITYPEKLPIITRRDEIIAAIKKNQVVIVSGETGSGKTTQLPKFCLEAGYGLKGTIAITQPRRIAAISIAKRLAAELNVQYGRKVGAKVRFRNDSGPDTSVKVVTDGMLLTEIQNDIDLLDYDTIIVDEAHERSLNIDFIIGYLQLLRRRRPNLRVIITSATINTELFSAAFDNAPVIHVSGRSYPVEVRYETVNEERQESGDHTYIDAISKAVRSILKETDNGDILVFMPSERDIFETKEKIENKSLRNTSVLPLFSRLTTREQQRIFKSQTGRRVILATNIAETSLTIPNIRFVVDTGLVRISRYNSRTHTQRLPIEPISQSSAEQRKGRCGRTANGICIRLYDERDFESRPQYTEPEIQRSNLADVILQMLSLRLGPIEKFPFIDSPEKTAIDSGFQLLFQLGAINKQRQLTKLGRAMARLPVDPTIARMILQARTEKVLPEVLVIASAISVQDPRERPPDSRELADDMHRRYNNERSDFITYLNIWQAYHKKMEKASQNQLRKFCRAHYLSYMRMREWRDIHTQIGQVIGVSTNKNLNTNDVTNYEAIHRSILTGLLSNVAQRKDGNLYTTTRNREIMIFPGSGLYKHNHKEKGNKKPSSNQKSNPEWIVAGETVETSRLFARTIAQIDPDWLIELGAHLCRRSYEQPYWNIKSGRVLVQEKYLLYGLEVMKQPVDFGRVNPNAATEVFIRESLIPGEINSSYDFLIQNRRLCDKLEVWQNRNSSLKHLDIEEATYRFYHERIEEGTSSTHDLNRLIKKQGDGFLRMKASDILEENASFDSHSFPDTIQLDQHSLPVEYAYNPGGANDGLTVTVPYKLIDLLNERVLEWLVPGLREEKITGLLRNLPKRIRKQLLPITEKSQHIAKNLKPTQSTFVQSLHEYVHQNFNVDIQISDWKVEELPEHLQMRVKVKLENEESLTGRDLNDLRKQIDLRHSEIKSDSWIEVGKNWQQTSLTNWDIDDQPERIEVSEFAGIPIFGYPGLEPEDDEQAVTLKLYKDRNRAESDTKISMQRLCSLDLHAEIAWLRRELKTIEEKKSLYKNIYSSKEIQLQAYENLVRYLFHIDDPLPLRKFKFTAMLDRAKKLIHGLSGKFLSCLFEVLEKRHALVINSSKFPEIKSELERIIPMEFLLQIPFEQLIHIPRYLKALEIRSERIQFNPQKDLQRSNSISTYQIKLDALLQEDNSNNRGHLIEEFRWLLEEFRVSVFAQELGTVQSVSTKRLDKKLLEIQKTP